jgi:integrase/recombinase XerD
MDARITQSSDVVSTNESLSRVGCRPGVQPSAVLPRSTPERSQGAYCPDFEKKARALQWALDRLAGRALPGQECLEEYLRDMYRRNCRPNTFKSALLSIETFLLSVAESGKTRLETITKTDLEAFIEREQDRGLMISTIRTKLNYIQAFLRYGIEAEVVSSDVLARRIRLRKPETLPKAMDPDDLGELLSIITDPRDRAMVMVLLRTGMRIGELLNTRMPDLHLRDRRIDIYEGEKNRVGRVVYLSDDALHALKAWLKVRESHQTFLFYAKGRSSMAYSTARLMFEQYLTRAGLTHKGYSLHSLRHTFASELLNAGMRIECLQPLMGHSSLDVTRRYARLTDKTREEEYFRAMTIIERGHSDGHDRCDHPIQALPEETKRLTEYR